VQLDGTNRAQVTVEGHLHRFVVAIPGGGTLGAIVVRAAD
jgi:hypothetical protein